MTEKLLHLIDRNLDGVEQDGRDLVPQQVRIHPLAVLPKMSECSLT
jgi:hypothetical protein